MCLDVLLNVLSLGYQTWFAIFFVMYLGFGIVSRFQVFGSLKNLHVWVRYKTTQYSTLRK